MMGLVEEGIYAGVESLGYMRVRALRASIQGVKVTGMEGSEVVAWRRGGVCYR